MTIRVAIQHKMHYAFDRLVNLSPHVVRLRFSHACQHAGQ